MSVFVTTMYRYGDREKHSYVLGVWSSSGVAMQAGQTEALWRGGKYEPEVTEWKVDANEFDDIGEERPTQRAGGRGYGLAKINSLVVRSAHSAPLTQTVGRTPDRKR